jgi:hypothetical protein
MVQVQGGMFPDWQASVGMTALFSAGVLAAQILISTAIMSLHVKSWLPLGDRVQRIFWWACLCCGLLFLSFELLDSPFGL